VTLNDLERNGVMAIILRYFTEFVYNVVLKHYQAYLGFKIYFW